MHYDLHGYYCVSANCSRALRIRRVVQPIGTVIEISKGYRDAVAHLNVPTILDRYIGEMKKITSYYAVFVYAMQRYLLDEQRKYVSKFNDELSKFTQEHLDVLSKTGNYSKVMLWIMNAPFAYNLARYKNLSIEDLFYGKPTKEKLYEDKMVVSMLNKVPQATQTEYVLGDVVTMTKTELTVRGGLRGYIKGTGVKITVSPNSLLGKNKQKYIGRELRLKIVKWDENAQAYNGELC